ncbi:unnamed protein product [Pylaiella littoralis]
MVNFFISGKWKGYTGIPPFWRIAVPSSSSHRGTPRETQPRRLYLQVMALSLVGDYGGSGSSSEESDEESEEEQTKPTSPRISLPSAADLFDSVDTSTASFMSAPAASEDVPLTTPKRKKADSGGSSGSNRRGKYSKGGTASSGGAAAGAGAGGASNKGLIPPQMSRPNVVTEDSALWSSDASMKRQRQGEAERRGAAAATPAAAAAGGKGGKGGKDSLTFKQREKASRDKGQASRGKSYVEEEKRLLRELGSS